MKRSRILAKTMLVFFALLFIAVLIHPDVDLLDVHDVRITSARSKLTSVEGRVGHPVFILPAGLSIGHPAIMERLSLSEEALSSRDVSALSVLRI